MIYPNSKRFLPIYKIDYSKKPLTFKSLDGNGYVKFSWMNYLTAYYSVNDGQWQSYNQEKVYFSNKGDTVAFSGIASNDAIHDCSFDLDVYITGIQKRVQVYGNLGSIKLMYSGDTWQQAFSEQLNLVDASYLVLDQLKEDMYSSLFYHCSTLTAAPESLPATYSAPGWCYAHMFDGCKALLKPPKLPTSGIIGTGAYSNMFKGCTSLTSAPQLPATQLRAACYEEMFSGCTKLINSPTVLPATKMYQECYCGMFKECSSLITAPHIAASGTALSSFAGMFSGCTNLSSIEVDLSYWGDNSLNATTNWVKNVAPTGTFTKPFALSTAYGDNYIPQGWTVVDK